MFCRAQKFSRMWLVVLVITTSRIFSSDNVLSIGNSLIEFNNQAAIIEALAASGGHSLKWTHRSQPGQSLQFHFDQGTGLDDAGLPTARNLIRQGGWTHIVLQEFSSRPREDAAAFFSAVRLFKDEISTYCPGAKILLFENWPYNDSANYESDIQLLDANYSTIANEVGIGILPIAHGFDLLRIRDKYKLNPYVLTDDKHPSLIGSYISACIIVRAFYAKPRHFLNSMPSGISIREARLLQRRAKNALRVASHLRL